MIITCPQCETKYRISGDKLKPKGSKVRCSVCNHIFTAYPEVKATDQLTTEDYTTASARKDSTNYAQEGDFEYSSDQRRDRSGKKFGLFLLLAAIVVLIAAGYYFYPRWHSFLPFYKANNSQSVLNQKEVKSSRFLKNIDFRDVQEYLVQNKKLGQLLVIEGNVVNNADVSRKRIKLKATLYDKNGTAVNSKEFFCGKQVPRQKLQEMDQQELKAILKSEFKELNTSKRIQPGEEVPFMCIFPIPSAELSEFSLQAVQYQENDQSQ